MSNAALAFALLGAQGECKIESLESTKKFCTAMYANGIWEKRRTHIGEFTHQISDVKIPYLKESCVPAFTLTLPKLPVGIYNEVLRFFRDIYNTIKSEVFIGIFWNLTTKDYELYVPAQDVAGASITYKRDEGKFVDANLVHVMDIHSHCNFGAGFSGTDTADETSTKMFGVIGNILTVPSQAWRAGCNQKFVSLKFEDIFDKDSTKTYTVGEGAVARVKEKVYPKLAYPTYPVQNHQAWRSQAGLGATPARRWIPPVNTPSAPKRTGNPALESYDYYESLYDNQIYSSVDYDVPGSNSGYFLTTLDSVLAWASPEYYEAVNDFDTVLSDWVDSVNDNTAEGANNRQLISQFFDMVNSCDQMDLNFLKYVINEAASFTTERDWQDLLQHMQSVT